MIVAAAPTSARETVTTWLPSPAGSSPLVTTVISTWPSVPRLAGRTMATVASPSAIICSAAAWSGAVATVAPSSSSAAVSADV